MEIEGIFDANKSYFLTLFLHTKDHRITVLGGSVIWNIPNLTRVYDSKYTNLTKYTSKLKSDYVYNIKPDIFLRRQPLFNM